MQILLSAAALVGQSLLVTGLLYQRYRRQQAELESRQRTAELARMNRRFVAGEMSASIAHELNQPLTAILSNAEAAHDLLGRRGDPARKIINVSTRAYGKHVEVIIVDFGHGIAADVQQRLFEPFFTTKEHGLGLGLSICSTIVKAHGGNLRINSNDYGGATVLLSFLSAPAPSNLDT